MKSQGHQEVIIREWNLTITLTTLFHTFFSLSEECQLDAGNKQQHHLQQNISASNILRKQDHVGMGSFTTIHVVVLLQTPLPAPRPHTHTHTHKHTRAPIFKQVYLHMQSV